jgi:arylsulfatase A-like enzyme
MKILVLDVPALHTGYLGCYGNDWVGTPNIDRFATASVVFDRHFIDVEQPDPLAWTGHHLFPGFETSPFPDVPTLGELLAETGAQLITGTGPISVEGLDGIVAQIEAALEAGRPFVWARLPALAPPWDLPADLLNSYCEDDEEPWPDPPHGLLEDPDDLLRLQNTYAAVVTYVDAQLGVLLDSLGEPGRLDDTLVCLTASHGLPLAEHGVIGLAEPWLHEEFVHLPLLLRLPRAEHGGLRVAALTQPVDLFPTLLESLGKTAPPSHGHSLWPLMRADVNQVRSHACSGLRRGDAVEWALRTLEWAFLLPVTSAPDDRSRQPRLYVKPDDRWEVNNVRQHHLELAEKMEQTLRDFAAASRLPAAAPLQASLADATIRT